MAPAFVRTIGRGTLPWYCLNGLGLAFCLMANGIFDRVVSQRSSVATFAVRISADDPLTGGLTAIAACAVLALAALRYHRELRVGYVVGAVGAVVQVVCLAGIYLASGGVIPLGLGTAAGLVLGAASVLFLALWAQLLAHSGLHRALTVLAMALAADTLFDLASALLVEGAVVALSAVAFAAGPLLLAAAFSAEKALGMAGDPGAGGSLGVAAPPTPDAARVTVPTPARPHASSLALGVLCLAVYGFAMGRVQSTGSDFAVVGLASLLMDHAVNLGALVAAGAAVLAARLKDPAGFLRMAVLVLLLAALYLSGVFGVVVGPAGMVVMSVARIVAFVYVWVLSAQAGAPGLPPTAPPLRLPPVGASSAWPTRCRRAWGSRSLPTAPGSWSTTCSWWGASWRSCWSRSFRAARRPDTPPGRRTPPTLPTPRQRPQNRRTTPAWRASPPSTASPPARSRCSRLWSAAARRPPSERLWA